MTDSTTPARAPERGSDAADALSHRRYARLLRAGTVHDEMTDSERAALADRYDAAADRLDARGRTAEESRQAVLDAKAACFERQIGRKPTAWDKARYAIDASGFVDARRHTVAAPAKQPTVPGAVSRPRNRSPRRATSHATRSGARSGDSGDSDPGAPPPRARYTYAVLQP